MQEQTSLQNRILLYCQQEKHDAPLDLSECDLTGFDLCGLDLGGVNLTCANLTRVQLEGTRLQAATIIQACFTGVQIGVLMVAGLSPRVLLDHRSEADRRNYPALHFSSAALPRAPLHLSAKECRQVCHVLQESYWERLADEAVFTVLYPTEPWDDWMARCHNRLILTWALEHRAFLNRTASNIPFYGRVLPSTLMDEVEESDLVAGIKTSPERVFHALGLRQIVKQSDLQGSNVEYPLSPFGDAKGVVQIKSREALQLEGGLMHHCVASYDQACLSGQCFIYHIGPTAPEGSTLEMEPSGSIGQHRAMRNRAPGIEDRNRLTEWLTSLGMSHETSTPIERICGRLRLAGIVKVSFQTYWYDDEDTIADVEAFDKDGDPVVLRTVSDDDLWDLVHEEHGSQYGQWELNVEEKRLDWVGAETPPDEDECYDEEDDYDGEGE
jgi:hypothetical protein